MSSERDASVTGPDQTIGTGIAHAVLLEIFTDEGVGTEVVL